MRVKLPSIKECETRIKEIQLEHSRLGNLFSLMQQESSMLQMIIKFQRD
jgi:hypothetical protein